MFQIPDEDEDDEFWKEFPLEEFENVPVSKGEKRQGSPLEKPQEEHKKPCTRNIENGTIKRLIPDSGLRPNNLPTPTLSNNNSNGNLPLQDVHLSSNRLLPAGISQKTGGHPGNSASPFHPHEKHQAMTRGSAPGNCPTAQHQQQPLPNDRCQKRKFPGPAGMLPRLGPGQKLADTVMKLDGRPDTHIQKNENLLSPNPVGDFFGESPWLKLVSDLGEDSSRILKMFSIRELQSKACKKQLPQGKVLLLFTVLETVDLSSIDASVKLRDPTGSIQGTIHRNLIKEHGEHLQPGTVLVLKQVGVLSPTQRNHYLNITSNNLVSLYSALPSGQVGIHWQEEGVTYHQLVTNAERLQKSQMFSSPARPPPQFRKPVHTPPLQRPPPQRPPFHSQPYQSPSFRSQPFQGPHIKNLPPQNRTPSPYQINPSQNVGFPKNSPLNSQAKSCDKISGFPTQKFQSAPNVNSTIGTQHTGNNYQGSSSFSTTELSKASPGISPNGRSRWTFKSKASVSNEIPGPSLSSSSSSVPGHTAPNTNSLNPLSSCQTFGNDSSMGQAQVSAGCSSGDKYRLRTENCPNPNAAVNNTTEITDAWQDDLSDDILSQLSDDLF